MSRHLVTISLWIAVLSTAILFFQCSNPQAPDNTPPTCTIIYPTAGQALSGTINIVVEASDNDDVDHVSLRLDGELVQVWKSKPYEYSWNTAPIADNQDHSIQAIAVDKSSNAGFSGPTNIRLVPGSVPDTLAPTISIISPVTGSVVSDTVSVISQVQDNGKITKVEYYIDGYLRQTITQAPFEYQWVITNYIDSSSHTIFGRVFDENDNSTYSNVVTVTARTNNIVDTTPPTTSIIYPTAASTVSDTVEILVTAEDNLAVDHIDLYVDGHLQSSISQAPWKFAWDVSGFINGSSHSILVMAYDTNQNQGVSAVVSVTVQSANIIDTTPPTIFLSYPPAAAVLTGTTTIIADANDNVSVDRVNFYIDGDSVGVDNTYPYEYVWDISTFAPGSSHTIYAKAYDGAGNHAETGLQSVSIAMDTTAPSILLSYPPAGAVLTGTTTIVVDAHDDVAVDHVSFYIDGFLVGTDNAEPYEYVWDISNLAPGSSHTIYARAYDPTGNQSQTPLQSVSIAADITPPSVFMVQPLTGAVLTGTTTTVIADASDNVGVERVVFFIDGDSVGFDTSRPYQYVWNISSLTPGSSHMVYTRAYDSAGNQAQSSLVTVTIANNDITPPQVTILYPSSGSAFTAGDTIAISVDAQDDTGVQKVEFYIDGDLHSTVTSTPYRYEWDTTGYATGQTHSIFVKAYDLAGNTATELSTITLNPQ